MPQFSTCNPSATNFNSSQTKQNYCTDGSELPPRSKREDNSQDFGYQIWINITFYTIFNQLSAQIEIIHGGDTLLAVLRQLPSVYVNIWYKPSHNNINLTE